MCYVRIMVYMLVVICSFTRLVKKYKKFRIYKELKDIVTDRKNFTENKYFLQICYACNVGLRTALN